MQNQSFAFPHDSADTMTRDALRWYWYTDSIFRMYSRSYEDWLIWRNSPWVAQLSEFYMRCKCLLEHMYLEDTEFYAVIDRITTVTQILLYEVLQRKRDEEDELCRKWGSTLECMEHLWIGNPLSIHRRIGSYEQRMVELKRGFQPLIVLAETIRIR